MEGRRGKGRRKEEGRKYDREKEGIPFEDMGWSMMKQHSPDLELPSKCEVLNTGACGGILSKA